MPRQEQGQVIRYAGYPVSRWKNGVGETRQIARHPPAGEFDWRVSMATVAVPAEFSVFPGIERWLGVAAGGSLAVTVGEVEHTLEIGGEPLRFCGSVPAAAQPLYSPVTDVNLMVRSDAFSGKLVTLGSGHRRFAKGELLVISLVDRLQLRVSSADAGSFDVALGHLGTWWMRASEPITIEANGSACSRLAYIAQLWPVHSPQPASE